MSLSSFWIEISQITKKSLFSKFRSRKSLEIYFFISQIIKNNCTQCQESFLIVQHLISSLNRGSKFFDPENRSKMTVFFNLASPRSIFCHSSLYFKVVLSIPDPQPHGKNRLRSDLEKCSSKVEKIIDFLHFCLN